MTRLTAQELTSSPEADYSLSQVNVQLPAQLQNYASFLKPRNSFRRRLKLETVDWEILGVSSDSGLQAFTLVQ